MSHLQIGLAIGGGLVLAGDGVQAAWSARKNRPPATPTRRQRCGRTQLGACTEPGRFGCGRALKRPVCPGPCRRKSPALDALIDVIAPIALDNPVSGEAALVAMPATRRAGSKPFSIEGLNEANQRWEMPLAGQRYGMFQAGVQLANRSGALNEIEYSEFVMKTQAFCDAINGTPDFPEMREEVARARELDQFASEHDAQLGFVLRARTLPGARAMCSKARRAWALSRVLFRGAWSCRPARRGCLRCSA